MKRIVSIILVLIMMLVSVQTAFAGGAGGYPVEFDGKEYLVGTSNSKMKEECAEISLSGLDSSIETLFIPAGIKLMRRVGDSDQFETFIEPVYDVHLYKEYDYSNFTGNDFSKVTLKINSTLKTIIFENGIEYISADFINYSKLKTVVIPESVKIIYVENAKNITFYVKSGSYAEWYLKQCGFDVKNYVSMTYNGDEVYSDQPAVIVGGRTFVPLRAALESMGATVDWNNDTRTVISERGGTKISLAIGSNQMYVNGTAKTIDVPAQLINGRTMVPARAVAEAFGCDVSWDNDTRTAIIKE